VDLQTAVAGFSPAFAPVDASLAPAAFLTFLNSLDAMGTDVGTAVGLYTNGVQRRTPMMADIQDRALRVLSLVKSNASWAAFLPNIKKLVDKIRGNTPKQPKPPAPGEGPGSPPAKKRNTGEQSFADIEDNFEKLIAALGSVPGYTPPASDLTIANLTTLATDFAAKNLAMSTLGNTIGMKQKARLEAFDGPGGLKEKMKAIKEAVRSQYGSTSAEYEQVKGIKV
jgi:hypothetical protein